MPSMRDLMATSQAAGQMAGAGPDAGAPPPGMLGPGSGAPPPEQGAAPDLEGAIANLEAAVSAVAPEALEDVMVHVNAIRELISAPPEAKGEGEVVEPSPEAGSASEAKNVEATER